MSSTIFERYPALSRLRSLVSDDFIEKEVSIKLAVFEQFYAQAKNIIPTVNLADVFPAEIENAGIYLEKFLGHWGNSSIETVAKVALMCKFLQPKKIFEFGTYNGMTTRQMVLNTPAETQIYTLDLPPGSAQKTHFQLSKLDQIVSDVFLDKFGNTIGSYFKDAAEQTKITQIFADSSDYDYTPYKKQIDLIFIDAAHDYENKKSDSENALKMLTDDGLIIWDNYADVLNPDVTRYLFELAQQLPLYHLRNTYLVVYWKGRK